MPVIKHMTKQDYTVVDNTCLRDRNLDLDCRGLLITMLSLPDNWDFSGRGLSSILPCGKSKVFRILKELETAGYLKREEIRDERGRIADTAYYISATPIFKEEISEETEEESKSEKCENTDNNFAGKYIKKNTPKTKRKDKAENNKDKNAQSRSSTMFAPCPIVRDTVTRDTEILDTEKRNNNKIYNNKILNNQVNNNQSINQSNIENDRLIDNITQYREIIEDNIGFDDLKISLSESALSEAEEIVELMTEIVATNTKPIKINGNLIPAEIIKKRFLEINYWHIQYILDCLDKNVEKINNIRSYLIAVIFNATTTMNNYYSAEVRHDFYGDDG